MSDIIRIKKGLNIRLKGKADKIIVKAERPAFCALKPPDFRSLSPKLVVKPGDEVKVGTVLFYDKYHPEIKYVSTVAGEVSEIRRGERRFIREVVIKVSEVEEYIEYNVDKFPEMTAGETAGILLESGMWPLIRQRPYDTTPIPGDKPKAVFISGFDTSPLAPDIDYILKDSLKCFQKGIDVLTRLAGDVIHLGIDGAYPLCNTFADLKGVILHKFTGPHPAGNVGIQIHHINPINKGDVVWYIRPQDVVRLGNLFITGKIDNTMEIALTGSEVLKPMYYKTIRGTSVSSFINNKTTVSDNRIISGNVLTGTSISRDGFLGFYDNQITVIPEGKKHEFLGWALPGFNKFSFYRSFFSWLMQSSEYRVDTNLHGGERAFVLTGAYEKVIPMDILPMQLLKAIIIGDIDQMEKLGIYEVSEEDFALAEFVCPSKTEIQSLIRHGLDLIRKEME